MTSLPERRNAQETLLKKYVVLSQLGQGSFARVYMGKDRTNGAIVAIKHVIKGNDSQKSACLLHEKSAFKFLCAFPHPNVVKCYESFEDDLEIFFVQEYLPHGDLPSFLRKVELANSNSNSPKIPNKPNSQSSTSYSQYSHLKLNEELIKKLIWGMAKGVKHLHSIGLVHRDLKLENICIGSDWEPKLIDFNFTTKWSEFGFLKDPFGTLVYCCPEIYHGKAYRGPEVDIWSIGILIFSLLFNSFPFSSEIPKNGEKQLSNSEKIQQIGWKVVKGEFNFPINGERIGMECPNVPKINSISEESKELIKLILKLDGKIRPNIQQIMEHNWFKELRDAESIKKLESLAKLPNYRSQCASAPILISNSDSSLNSSKTPKSSKSKEKEKDDFNQRERRNSIVYKMLRTIF